MASEAQRLIGISLTKIAQSRAHRGGVSLHKNLLVATVLQKARYIFMEEAYNMVQYQNSVSTIQMKHINAPKDEQPQQQQLVGLTAEEAGILPQEQTSTSTMSSSNECLQDFLQPQCVKCSEKENQPPSYYSSGELTYLDLDKTPTNILRDNSSSSNNNNTCLKRRRAVTEWETEEAVQSILPKRSRSTDEDDSVFLEDAATVLSDTISKEFEAERLQQQQQQETNNNAMEIDRITSLVSIFSFGMGDNSCNKLNRSVSTPDLCSAQAKDSESIQQRPFLAMTV